MNIALEQTEEYVNGVLTNSYGDAFVRGNNGEHLLATAPKLRSSITDSSSCTRVPWLCSILASPVHQQTVMKRTISQGTALRDQHGTREERERNRLSEIG